MRFKLFIPLVAFIFSSLTAISQDKSNRGKEFWLGYGFDYSFFWESPVNNQELALYISTEQAATVTVSINNTGFTQTLNIPANTVDATILIPKSGPNDARILTDGLSNKGIHIVSDVPVAVYAHVYSTMVSGATMLMPVETYGYSYYSVNYYQTTSQSSPTDWYSWFYAIASENNTRIQITPSDTTKNGWLPGQTYTVNLNKGETFNVFGKAIFDGNAANASKDMTGSKVISVPGADGICHPIGLFSGSGGIRLCRGDGGEFVHQQMFPSQAWGTRYLTYHTINNTNTDILETNRNYYRVCVQNPATVVKRNGVVLTGLIKNFFYEFMDSTGGDYIEANNPILVAQYTPNKNQCWNYPVTNPSPPSYGDPEMFYLSPIEQGQKSVLFYTSRKSSIDYVYANIHLPTTALASLRVDGNPVPLSQTRVHPNLPTYSVALVRFVGAANQHTISADSTFTSTVYGLGNFESYGYNVGTLINNLNNYSAIKNAFNNSGVTDTFTCPKTPVRLFVKLAYPATSIHWKFSQVPGMTPSVDSIVTNPVLVNNELINGRNYYVYTLQQDFSFATAGTYYIPVSYTANVIENCSQTENATVKVVVKPGLVADFNIANANCLRDTVSFTGIPTPGSFTINNYLWNFDDASTASTINTKKKFLTDGTQHVRFRIYATNGCAGDTTKIINIFPQPIAKIGAASPVCSGDSVLISDTSSITTGTISQWQYLFGDGNSVTRTSNTPFNHAYTTAGTYFLKLVTSSNNACTSDTAYKTIQVNAKPIARFGYNRNICLGDSVMISDSSSIASGSISSWKWDFGDGNTLVRSSKATFYHSYTAAGSYPLKLVVLAQNGCLSDTFKLTVNVSNKPTATFTMNGLPCVDSVFNLSSSFPFNSLAPNSWYWDFGDGQVTSILTANTTTHRYANTSNNIKVKHVVNAGLGCTSDTAILTIPIIHSNPTAAFTIVGDTLCENKTILFTTPVNPSISAWNWNFGNGLSTAQPPISYTYTTANTYQISLVVKDAAGCGSLPVQQSLVIHPLPPINAGVDKFINKGSSVVLDATITNPSLYQFIWSPPTDLSTTTVLNPIATPSVSTKYTVLAVNPLTLCSKADDVKVDVISKLFIPNAFTPNRDNVNDRWIIPGLELYPDAIVTIYNRWGQVILSTKDYNKTPWEGLFKGVEQPVGVYVYYIQLNNPAREVLNGQLNLIR